jgi:hypothetical protein
LHQALKRAPSIELLRGVFDTAMSIYLDRFLNMPPQRIPEPGQRALDGSSLRSVGAPIQSGPLLERMNVQQQVEEAAQIVSDYLSGSADPDGILATLGHAMLREDAGFHSFQIMDAGIRQYQERRNTEAGRHVLIGMARFLAAHSPTSRAVEQTYRIAVRLHRGEELYHEV